MIASLLLALLPKTGKIRLGPDNSTPSSAGLPGFDDVWRGYWRWHATYSTAELAHFANNPDVIMGVTSALERDNLSAAYKWTLLHYGLTPWGCYAIVGMSIAYFAYRRNMPLTIRSPFAAVLKPELTRRVGGVVDAAAILATIIGIGVTIGYGVNQLTFGMHQITDWDWLVTNETQPDRPVTGSHLTMAAMLSALSGIGRGIRWLQPQHGSVMALLFIFIIFAPLPSRVKCSSQASPSIWALFPPCPSRSGMAVIRNRASTQRLAIRLDNFLLGLVDCVCAFLDYFSRVSQSRTIT